MPAVEKPGQGWTKGQSEYLEDCILLARLSREFGAGRGQIIVVPEGGHNYFPDNEVASRVGIHHTVLGGPTTATEDYMVTIHY